MHIPRFTHLILIVGLAFILLSCNQDNPKSLEKTKLKIAIVGELVPGTTQVSNRPYSRERAFGPAIWFGASSAFHNSPRLKDLDKKIELITYDDGGTAENSVVIANQISNRPDILAVIGHASSQTTKIAAPVYSSVNIPLVMPVATSPLVF